MLIPSEKVVNMRWYKFCWSNHAGSQFRWSQFRYYMVFKEETDLPKGAVSMSKFLEIIKVL